METTITKIKKRDGRVVKFDQGKITVAIYKAAVAVGGSDRALADKLSDRVVELLEEKYDGHTIPTVEEVQDFVEKVLIESGHAKTAKAYILYRQKRKELREAKSLLGVEDDVKLTLNAIRVLERRYLRKDENGKVVETPKEMFKRVAKNVARADVNYGAEEEGVKKTEREFYKALINLEFVPNSPTLMNAGRELQQLSACFVLPIEDSMESIFEAIKNTALIHRSGGGTGFSFSRIRPAGDIVKSTSGVASGPISFMKVFNIATEVIKQGGTRRGANMAILRVDHPDILDFVVAKERNDALTNFNISVGLTERFMEAVEKDEDYDLINPHTKQPVNRLNARRVFDLIVTMAWKNGEPGIVFLDRLNKDNPTPALGEIESTNPCGEQPLLPYESCNLGSLNLSKVITYHDNKAMIDYPKLKRLVRMAVHFLDNVIDMNKYPLPQIEKMTLGNRKIGLGVMGFSDMLIELGIPYNSEEATKLGGDIMKFIHEEGNRMSQELAEARGPFPNFKKSVFAKTPPMRNATVTTIAPTGTISIIAGCSSGIEPLFAISYVRRNILDTGDELIEVNPLFERIAREKGFYSEPLMRLIARKGSIQSIEEIPPDVRRVFTTAHDITPEDHVRMQAAFQEYTDNAVSKTVNFPHDASTEDIEKVYVLAYKLGCKGVTIYRDRSREQQVLNIDSEKCAEPAAKASAENPEECPVCPS
ncbi:MAG: vitamin B12-dependent ribonucleotide reductase [Candidatus Altiarchaeota archaeon]|nr:vitamin B12-dependent ribonucleotide reductase [Candidatus Altiarchaeota archaeon]